ncbi:MAG: NAD(P) transhydrogenase subunit alpha [Bacteroidota bacterium]
MTIGILREPDDDRVALVPAGGGKLSQLGASILVEAGAGLTSFFSDADYTTSGAVVAQRGEIIAKADLLISIQPPAKEVLDSIPQGTHLMALFAPFDHPEVVEDLQQRQLHAFSFDMVPRSSLAQSMDILSSMASIAGYRAVLRAAELLPRYLPMMITAAGTVKPAKVLVLGAGVAGLQAIATAKRLGAQVEASDVRLAAKEEVESLGAQFIQVEGATEDSDAGGYAVAQSEDFLQRQREEVARRCAKADVVITTALVRGRKAPILLNKETVEQMSPGSVVIDLAAGGGGNCELTQNGQLIDHQGVKILGDSNLAAGLPQDASTLFSNNVVNLLKLMVKDETWSVTANHEILEAARITPSPTN